MYTKSFVKLSSPTKTMGMNPEKVLYCGLDWFYTRLTTLLPSTIPFELFA